MMPLELGIWRLGAKPEREDEGQVLVRQASLVAWNGQRGMLP
jgi:hypothetical protein